MNLPKIDINLNGVQYEHSFEKDISIDRTDLDNEFAEQPARYAFYAFLGEEAKYLADRKKAVLENVEASVDAEKRAHALAVQAQNGKFKYTEKMCENEVHGDPRYKDALEAYHKAKLLSGQLDIAARAIAMRRDMLMQMGAAARIGAMPTRVLEAKREVAKEIIAASKAPDLESVQPVANIAEPQPRRRRK